MYALAPLWLIAEREFKTYVATASFWIALLVGPLLMAGLLAFTGLSTAPAAPTPIAIAADDANLAGIAADALGEAGRAEGRSYLLSHDPESQWLAVSRKGETLVLDARAAPALSPTARAIIGAAMERDLARQQLAMAQAHVSPKAAWRAPEAVRTAQDADRIARFCLMVMLWITLAGSLGMLLQAVVRERANRALESLLVAARPWQIVFGKLFGVFGVSSLVLAGWFGSSLAVASLVPEAGGMVSELIRGLGRPVLLLQAAVLYLFAFALFGLVTVAVGAAAGDSAAAQNQARPMFAVLLAVFFVALSAAGGAGEMIDALVYAPPFAPFLLLLEPASGWRLGASIGLLFVGIAAAGWLAVKGLQLEPVRIGSLVRRTAPSNGGMQSQRASA